MRGKEGSIEKKSFNQPISFIKFIGLNLHIRFGFNRLAILFKKFSGSFEKKKPSFTIALK